MKSFHRQSVARVQINLMLGLILLTATAKAATNDWTLIGWNNLGMHCMDRDYSVLSLLPPFNTFQAQLIDSTGKLIKDPTGFTVSYQAIADPSGSINKSSIGKSTFWQYSQPLYGVPLSPDVGLAGTAMPGASNSPQGMSFAPSLNWFIATGVPIIPIDDAFKTNTYPMMRLTARSGATLLATTDIVLPVSDEMDCRACHASSTNRSYSVWDQNPERDYRLNILKLHDLMEGGTTAFQSALTSAAYNAAGLYVTATTDQTPILCAKCHSSEALPGTGVAGVRPLTQAVHGRHAHVTDPLNGMALDEVNNRSACYRCHPGSTTRCLRGAMGSAVAGDGTMMMQCQSCHGTMGQVGAANRTGWLNEPACQQCHTGTAINNNGQIRFTSVFDGNGQPRQPVDQTFATNPNTPAAGLSLYRFSKGHGGIQCEGCHGSTHAEWPSSHANDNVQSIQTQGHVGVLAECNACHNTQPVTINGGPHGMHPVGQVWINAHHEMVDDGAVAQCRACHGADYRGTVLSRAKADRTVSAFGTRTFWRGFQIGCFTCHLGPNEESQNPNRAPVVQNASAYTLSGVPVNIALQATDANHDALTLRIVSQPAHGTVALNSNIATFFPDSTFSGKDTFTFAAWDGATDSNLGTVSIGTGQTVTQPSQPNLMIRASSDTHYTGSGVINVTAANQTRSIGILRRQSRGFFLKVLNSGQSMDNITVKGDGAVTGFNVEYYDNATGKKIITLPITTGSFTIPGLAPGKVHYLRMVITAGKSVVKGSTATASVTVTSATDPTKQDTVKAVVTVTR